MAFGWKERERCAEVLLLVGERERGYEGRGGLWLGEPKRGHQADGSCASSVTEELIRVELKWCMVGRWADVVEQPDHIWVVGYNYRVPFGS